VLYGKGKEPEALAVQPEVLRKALKTKHGLNTVLTLKFDAGKGDRLALLKDWDQELTTSRLLHADFVEISLDRAVRVEVPVHMVGKSKGVTDGGILDVVRHVLVLNALPANIPEAIEVDVTELAVGDAIHLHDLKLPEGVKSASPHNFAIVSCVAPKQEKEETVTAAAAVPGAEGAAAAPAADGKAAPAADGKAAPAAAAGKDAKAPAKK
jgi:large subunit ribosomal protein L25